MSKWLSNQISTKGPSNILLGKDMFTLTLVDLEYETSISILGIWKDDRTKIIVLPLFNLVTRINS